MRFWRFLIEPTSLQLTTWQADTLFGSLCWALRHRRGEEALHEFLQPFREGDPPFLFSDGLPEGYLPLPFSLRVQRVAAEDPAAYQKNKRLKKARFLPETEFFKACRGEAVEVEEAALSLYHPYAQMHASINRLTGTTTADDGEGGNLYQLEGHVLDPSRPRMALYVADRRGDGVGPVSELLRDLSLTGFGKKKSSGAGAFRLVGGAEPWNPPALSHANGFVTLSGFVPKQSDPTQGYWQVKVKHGKLGEAFATGGGSPFKIPWIVLESGSCFLTGNQPHELYGRLLTGLSAEHPEAVQYGYGFPLPMALPAAVWEAAS